MKAVWATSLALLLGGAAMPALAAPPASSPPPPTVEAAPLVPVPAGEFWGTTDGGPSSGRLYGSAEGLLWWLKQTPLPALVTRGDFALGDTSGTLGGNGTQVLFGGNVGGQPFAGGRFTVGAWLGDDQALAVEAGGFFLEQRHTVFSASGVPDGTAFVGLPFFDVGLGAPSVLPVFGATTLTGTVDARVLQRLWGLEANGRLAVGGDALRLSLLGGFRFLAEDEGLDLATNSTDVSGFNTVMTESFTTHNRFYGGQTGAAVSWCGSGLVVDVVGKVALGWTDETVNIHGFTINSFPGFAPVGGATSLLAQATNSGRFDRTRFAVVPEVDLKVGYRVTDAVTVSVGYTFLYISNVARPGNQIDLATTAPAAGVATPFTRPAFVFRDSDFWAQGLSLGLEFRY